MKNKPLFFLPVCFATLVAAGCATSPDKIAASSVSPLQYSGYSCKQIGAELARLERKSGELYYSLKKTADADTAQMAAGMILFWPTLFFLEGGDGPQAAEYARLKGELEALEGVSIRKKCGLSFPSAAPPVKEEAQKPKARQSH